MHVCFLLIKLGRVLIKFIKLQIRKNYIYNIFIYVSLTSNTYV